MVSDDKDGADEPGHGPDRFNRQGYGRRLILVSNIVNGALRSGGAVEQGCMTTDQILDYLVKVKKDDLLANVKEKRAVLRYYLNKLVLDGKVRKYVLAAGKRRNCWALADAADGVAG